MQNYIIEDLSLNEKKTLAIKWFKLLRNSICEEFEKLEQEKNSDAKFSRKSWDREGGGGGEMSVMYGEVFEKVGVNISGVWGDVPEVLVSQMPNMTPNSQFWAAGISIVAHMKSPKVPSVHFNTRMIVANEKLWFGGGSDLTPTFEFEKDTKAFHYAFEQACNNYNHEYYPKFKKECDEYFMIKHRNEPRGVGGIFFDYFNTGKWQLDLEFIKDIGKTFVDIFPKLVRVNYDSPWNENDKEKQLLKRGRYVEFNLVYDRGTKFGFLTGGNTEAILMSMPPICTWR